MRPSLMIWTSRCSAAPCRCATQASPWSTTAARGGSTPARFTGSSRHRATRPPCSPSLPRRDPDTPVPGGERPLGHVRVIDVELARSRVAAGDGWQPDPELRYAAVLVDVPLPPATVELRGDTAAAALVRSAARRSPHVREGTGDPGIAGDRFLVLAEPGALTVARADGTPLATPVPATPDGARTVAARLEHLTRWHLIKRLDNPVSTIAGQVSLEIVPRRTIRTPPAAWPAGTPHRREGRLHPPALPGDPSRAGSTPTSSSTCATTAAATCTARCST